MGVATARGLIVRSLRRGNRTVIWTPQSGVGFGNVLYAWLYAHQRQALGDDCRVLVPPQLEPWRELFPTLWTDLSVSREDVGLTDRRHWAWNSRFGEDFTREDARAFIQDHLAPAFGSGRAADAETVTVNVRRGDYYSQPHFRGSYSFDIAAYLEVALARTRAEHGSFSRLQVVSDGIDWCHLKLDSMLREHASEVSYVGGSESPQQNFGRVAGSSRLVGTNSSFSYWAGYVSNVLFGDESHIVMPRFHARLGESPDAYQLDPEWLIVDDIPGGWDA